MHNLLIVFRSMYPEVERVRWRPWLYQRNRRRKLPLHKMRKRQILLRPQMLAKWPYLRRLVKSGNRLFYYTAVKLRWKLDDCCGGKMLSLSLSCLCLPIVSLASATLTSFISLLICLPSHIFSPEEGWRFSVAVLGMWYFTVCLWSVLYYAS